MLLMVQGMYVDVNTKFLYIHRFDLRDLGRCSVMCKIPSHRYIYAQKCTKTSLVFLELFKLDFILASWT
jgi:hypothetical protein